VAIGSNPEIGATFKTCRDYTIEDWEEWWTWMRTNWGNYLMDGYATLIHHKDNPYYKQGDKWK